MRVNFSIVNFLRSRLLYFLPYSFWFIDCKTWSTIFVFVYKMYSFYSHSWDQFRIETETAEFKFIPLTFYNLTVLCAKCDAKMHIADHIFHTKFSKLYLMLLFTIWVCPQINVAILNKWRSPWSLLLTSLLVTDRVPPTRRAAIVKRATSSR